MDESKQEKLYREIRERNEAALAKAPKISREKQIKVADFIKMYGTTCGGNWANWFMSAIRAGLPDVFEKMENREYNQFELAGIISENIDSETGNGKSD